MQRVGGFGLGVADGAGSMYISFLKKQFYYLSFSGWKAEQ